MDEILRRKITVAADDYGIRETAGSILELAQKKRLDRVAVFSERVTDDDMRALLETGVAIDIHLELIRLLKTGQEDEGSALSRGMNFFFRRIFGVVNQRKVQGEWRRQIILFRDRFGRLPDGLNSHEHVHYFPEFFSVAVDLAQEFGISRVRLGSEGIILGSRAGLTARILSVCSRMDRDIFRRSKRESSTWVTSFDWFADEKEFFDTLDAAGYSDAEVVFHPERPEERRILESW
jgi:predicted glycoside hydrolase/deacetylase ChbG (UPF0249 family)